MIVVSNSSPLVGLSAVGHFELLRDLYGTIIIPRAVHHEVVV
jgi:predicted nucleic acid-binding protein